MKKTRVKRKYVKRNTVGRPPLNQRPVDDNLKIDGPTPDFSGLEISKNTDVPRARGSFYWDHLINTLDKGDSFQLPKTNAGAFSVRARKLGYVVVLAKYDDEITNVWFGGLKKQ